MARKRQTRSTAKKRNLDPLSAMSIAQATGADRVLLGKKGFAALTDKRTYFGPGKRKHGRNPEDIDFLNEMAPYPSRGHLEFTPDGIERYVRGGYVYQAFTNTPVFGDGYRVGTPEASVDELARVNPAKYERCVRAVQQSSPDVNAYAVCTAKGLRGSKRNPATDANAVYEQFHGTPPSETLAIRETQHVHSHLAGLGELVCITIKLTGGKDIGAKRTLNAPSPSKAPEADIVHLACNEDRNQLYFVGGDQSLPVEDLGYRANFDIVHDGERFEATELKDFMLIGKICKITYRTEKEFDNFKTIDYYHKAGEDTKDYPYLTYDLRSQKMGVAGGSYTIDAKGIVN